MAIAISNINLQDIYALSPEEKLDLIDLIVKSMKSVAAKAKGLASQKEVSWVDQFEGKWEDSRSAEEMVADIRNARTLNTPVSL